MAKKNSYDYFGNFKDCAQLSAKAAEKLAHIFSEFSLIDFDQARTQIHEIEHVADAKQNELMKNLAHEFLPPIELEDIITVSKCLDEVTDSIDDIMQNVYMYNIAQIRPDAVEFAKLISEATNGLYEVISEFGNFKKSEKIEEYRAKVNLLEAEGDDHYIKCVRTLTGEKGDPLETLSWVRIYQIMEKCMDSCESAANAVQNVIMKNT